MADKPEHELAIEDDAPWFAGKNVKVAVFRVNRRPVKQPSFFATHKPEFFDHLAECLLFGDSIINRGKGGEREWALGNRHINIEEQILSGFIGYETLVEGVEDSFNKDEQLWQTHSERHKRSAAAPFAIAAGEDDRVLCVALHSSFAISTLPNLFSQFLQMGEESRPFGPSVDWGVEPLLDEEDFSKWLQRTVRLDKVRFEARLPNPDASDAFRQITESMDANNIGELDTTLKANDREAGIKKDLDADPYTGGLLEMARRSFATLKAWGVDRDGKPRDYSQRQRVRRVTTRLPGTNIEARVELSRIAAEQKVSHGDGGGDDHDSESAA